MILISTLCAVCVTVVLWYSLSVFHLCHFCVRVAFLVAFVGFKLHDSAAEPGSVDVYLVNCCSCHVRRQLPHPFRFRSQQALHLLLIIFVLLKYYELFYCYNHVACRRGLQTRSFVIGGPLLSVAMATRKLSIDVYWALHVGLFGEHAHVVDLLQVEPG